MQKTEIVCGLPWLHSKPERAIFSELGFSCVYAVGPTGGRPLRIGWARQLKDRMEALQLGCWKDLQIHDIAWTVGEHVAMRLTGVAHEILDKAKRRLTGDWFDITPEFGSQVIRLAAEKSNVSTFSHVEMLDRVRSERKRKIDAAIKRA